MARSSIFYRTDAVHGQVKKSKTASPATLTDLILFGIPLSFIFIKARMMMTIINDMPHILKSSTSPRSLLAPFIYIIKKIWRRLILTDVAYALVISQANQPTIHIHAINMPWDVFSQHYTKCTAEHNYTRCVWKQSKHIPTHVFVVYIYTRQIAG